MKLLSKTAFARICCADGARRPLGGAPDAFEQFIIATRLERHGVTDHIIALAIAATSDVELDTVYTRYVRHVVQADLIKTQSTSGRSHSAQPERS